jgi:hypothetical protein
MTPEEKLAGLVEAVEELLVEIADHLIAPNGCGCAACQQATKVREALDAIGGKVKP